MKEVKLNDGYYKNIRVNKLLYKIIKSYLQCEKNLEYESYV